MSVIDKEYRYVVFFAPEKHREKNHLHVPYRVPVKFIHIYARHAYDEILLEIFNRSSFADIRWVNKERAVVFLPNTNCKIFEILKMRYNC